MGFLTLLRGSLWLFAPGRKLGRCRFGSPALPLPLALLRCRVQRLVVGAHLGQDDRYLALLQDGVPHRGGVLPEQLLGTATAYSRHGCARLPSLEPSTNPARRETGFPAAPQRRAKDLR
jgi:hypothetical protein